MIERLKLSIRIYAAAYLGTVLAGATFGLVVVASESTSSDFAILLPDTLMTLAAGCFLGGGFAGVCGALVFGAFLLAEQLAGPSRSRVVGASLAGGWSGFVAADAALTPTTLRGAAVYAAAALGQLMAAFFAWQALCASRDDERGDGPRARRPRTTPRQLLGAMAILIIAVAALSNLRMEAHTKTLATRTAIAQAITVGAAIFVTHVGRWRLGCARCRRFT